MRRKITAMFVGCLATAIMLAACSKEAPQTARFDDGEGSLRISAVTTPVIGENPQTRATVELTDFMGDAAKKFSETDENGLSAWAMNHLRTRVMCIEDDEAEAYASESAVIFNYLNPSLTPVNAVYNVTMGSITASRTKLPNYTAPDGGQVINTNAPIYRKEHPGVKLVPEVAEGEGVDFIYFEGWNTCTVLANTDTEVDVEVKVANTAVTVEFTDDFRNYFPNGATVKLTTKRGGDEKNTDVNKLKDVVIASYDADGNKSKHYFWVRPQQFTLSAVAIRQNPSSTLTAEPITLEDYVRADDKVEPQTLYRCIFDVKNAGGLNGTITVTVDDTAIYTEDLGTIETNPNDDNYPKNE